MDGMATVSDDGKNADRRWPPGLQPEPPLGAHLTTSRRGYTHHGMYVGHGRVVHYSGFSGLWQGGPVEEVSLSRFAVGPVSCLTMQGAGAAGCCPASLGAGAFGGHLRCSDRCAVISPGAALIVDDVGNLGVAERAGKLRHDGGVDHASRPGALHSIEDHLNVFSGIVLIDDAASPKRRNYAR